MSRIDRLKEYAAMKGPAGENTAKNIAAFSRRAEKNSTLAPRASSEMKLPSTGKMTTRDTSMSPRVSRSVESVMRAAKKDLNGVGSSFMPNVRRTTT